ncbi:MAG: DNA topoisomerase IV subunit B [Acidobacteriota bacterium]
MPKQAVLYDEKAIQTLDPLTHIRKRTGMYIGRLGDGTDPDDGIYVLLKEVVDNAIDEFIMGKGKRIEIERDGDTVTVRDFGRGIPLGKVVDCVSRMHTGGKYNDDVFQFSVGLNGVGTKAVNALSTDFEVCSWREGKFKRAHFVRGKLQAEKGGKETTARDGTFVRFTPDPEIFGEYGWREEHIEDRLRYYAFLNTGLTLVYNGRGFASKGGLRDLLAAELGDGEGHGGGEGRGDVEPLYDIVHTKEDKLEFAFTHTNSYGEKYYSFVNGQHTSDGGTHQSAFREGLLRGINEFAGKSFAGADVRDGLIGAVAVKIQEPVFESQTKNKLGSTDVRPWIVEATRQSVMVWLHKNADVAERVMRKIEQNEKLRKELHAVKKKARERAKATAIRIPKLTDCKIHFDTKKPRADESTIFLTEGDSAGGSMVQSRDVDTQAIFSLRGKPQNTYSLDRAALYKNEELYNIMRALGIEESVDDLRYNRVVLATDADVDGMHIRNLLLTYFLRYFEELVLRGHVYIFETPLFRVRNKKETVYCYSEAERRAATERLRGPETTRFKGLGEISPHEMKRLMGADIRLVPVQIKKMSEVTRALEFYMGKNTPKRKDFIVENLISEAV